ARGCGRCRRGCTGWDERRRTSVTPARLVPEAPCLLEQVRLVAQPETELELVTVREDVLLAQNGTPHRTITFAYGVVSPVRTTNRAWAIRCLSSSWGTLCAPGNRAASVSPAGEPTASLAMTAASTSISARIASTTAAKPGTPSTTARSTRGTPEGTGRP